MLHSKTKNKHFVLALSIAVVLVGSFTLRYDKLSWGIPVDEVRPTRTPITPELSEEPSYYLRRGQYNEVIQKCSQLLAKDPKSQVYGMLSVAYAGLEQFDKASEAMQKAKTAGEPDASLIHISQAMMHRARKQYDAAITESRKAINLDAKNPLAYATLGMAYLGKKEQEKATEYLKKAIEVEPEYAHGHTALGANYLMQKKIREAFMEYKQATEIDPKDYRPHMGLGTIYTGMGMYYNAVNEYKAVLSLNPSSLSARTQLSALYLQVGKYDDAITEAKEVLRADSQSVQAYFILGRAYSFKNQFDVAIENLNQLLSLQPDSFEGNYLLGLSLMATLTSPPKNKDDFKSARQRFQKAEQINSKQADTAIAMGIIDHLEGDFQQALAKFERTITIGSEATDAVVHFLTANVYLSQKELSKAEEHLKGANGFILRFRADNLNLSRYFDGSPPQSHAHTNLAALYLFKGWRDKAIEECDLALKDHASNPIALYLKGIALEGKREFDQAIAQFQQVSKLEPQFISSHHELARLYLATNSVKQAIDEYHKVIELNPKDAFVHLELGAIYEREGKDKEALNEYQQVMTLAPDSAIGYNQLAYYYAERGRNLDQALTLALKAVELAEKSGDVIDTLGWVYLKRGDYSEALEKLKLANQLKPNSPSIRYHLGMAHFKNGDSQNALNEFKNALRISEKFPEVDDTKEMIGAIEEK